MSKRCNISAAAKRRDGKWRYWCSVHHANATGKGGTPLKRCENSSQAALASKDILELDPRKFGGGIALWGAVPAVYSTAAHDMDDLGVHVHARRQPKKKKLIDQTYKLVKATVVGADGSSRRIDVRADDAISYMVSSVFRQEMKYVECGHCGEPHLDKDLFAVTRHQTHLCFGCGKNFRDVVRGVGNPLMALKKFCGDSQINRRTVPADRSLNVTQDQFPLGIELWGSHEAILWTSSAPEESGIHFHGYTSNFMVPSVDETFDAVTIDGIRLDSQQLRTLMAQQVLPHLKGRIASLHCPACGEAHFDEGALAYTPHSKHDCACGASFVGPGRTKKLVSNPMLATLQKLERTAGRARR
jgi:hypothetical protein